MTVRSHDPCDKFRGTPTNSAMTSSVARTVNPMTSLHSRRVISARYRPDAPTCITLFQILRERTGCIRSVDLGYDVRSSLSRRDRRSLIASSIGGIIDFICGMMRDGEQKGERGRNIARERREGRFRKKGNSDSSLGPPRGRLGLPRRQPRDDRRTRKRRIAEVRSRGRQSGHSLCLVAHDRRSRSIALSESSEWRVRTS